jgi:hypothetical protein
MPKERGKWLQPVEQPRVPALALESTGTGLLGLFTRGPAEERNAARQAYRDAVALGMDPAEAARRYGPTIMGPGFAAPKTQAERQAEQGAFYQSLAREMFPAPETREVPTGAYQVGPPTGEYTEFFQPAQYEPEPEAFTATPTGAPIPTSREIIPSVEGQPMRLPRREPIEHRRAPGGGVLEPEVRPEIFQPPSPTHAQLLARQLPSQVAMFEQAYPELVKRRQEAEEQQALAALGPVAAPGVPAAPAPGAPPAVEGAAPAALSPTARVEAAYEPVLQRLRANPRVLVSETGKNYLERYRKEQEAAEKAEEAQAKRATAGQVQAFQRVAERRAEAAEAAGDLDQATTWRAVAANPTQYLPQEKERAERAEKADANRQRREIFGQMAEAETDPQRKQLYRLAQVDQKTAEEVGQMLAQSGKPVELKGQMYRYVPTPEGGLALERLPGGPPEEPERPIIIEGQAFRMGQTPEGVPQLVAIPGGPAPKAPKAWYEGLTRPEAEAMSRDPSLSPEQRRQAGEVAKALQTGAEKVAQAGVPQPVKPTQQSIGVEAERGVTLDMLDQMEQAVLDHPDWIGARGTVNAAKAYFGQAPKDFAEFKANADTVYAQELHRLAQGALTPGEITRYGAFLPRISADPREFQSSAQFMANMRVTKRMLRSLLGYHSALQAGRSREDAKADLLRTLEAERTAAAADKGKRDQSPETKREQAEAQRQGAPKAQEAARGEAERRGWFRK